jgi:hypothetical protein
LYSKAQFTDKKAYFRWLIDQYELQRPCTIKRAVNDVMKWCQPPDGLVEGKRRSDLYWLQKFAFDGEHTDVNIAHEFLVSFQLTNKTAWNKQSVANEIIAFAETAVVCSVTEVQGLAARLREHIHSRNRGCPTSAASKIATFAKPSEQIFIWDQLASRSARLRDHLRSSRTDRHPRLNALYKRAGAHDYEAYHRACLAALGEEQERDDFAAALHRVKAHVDEAWGPQRRQRYGPIDAGFIERRLLDKLMFWEGHWIRLALHEPQVARPVTMSR